MYTHLTIHAYISDTSKHTHHAHTYTHKHIHAQHTHAHIVHTCYTQYTHACTHMMHTHIYTHITRAYIHTYMRYTHMCVSVCFCLQLHSCLDFYCSFTEFLVDAMAFPCLR